MTAHVYQRASLYPKQKDAFYNDARYGLCEATTKAGKTYGAMDWLLAQAFGEDVQPGWNFWWVAPVYPQTEIAYNRIKRGLYESGGVVPYGKLSLRLPNGANIIFKSGEKSDNLYGDDVHAVIIDEASRLREESWHAVRTTLTKTRGKVRIIGNVKGRRNWFYNMARKAESGDPDMHYVKIVADDAVASGVLAAEEIEDARRILPEQVFKELYEAEPSDDGGNPFGLKAILGCIGDLSSKSPQCFGIDLAKSVDWTVVIGLDANGNVCRYERWQSPWQETKARILRIVCDVPALIDSTGVGDPIVEELQRTHSNCESFKFTQASKQQIMEGLAIAIQQRQITYPDGIIVNELESYEYEYTRTGVRYTCADGLHDDTVCALALANRRRTMIGVGDSVIEAMAILNASKNVPTLSQFNGRHRRF